MLKKFCIVDETGNIVHWNYSWIGCVPELMLLQSTQPNKIWKIITV